MAGFFTNLVSQQLVPIGLAVLVAAVVWTGVKIATGGSRAFAEAILGIIGIAVGGYMILQHDAVVSAVRSAAGG